MKSHICKFRLEKEHGFSPCMACDKWRKCNTFFHDGQLWTLCQRDYDDYWYNCEEVLNDFKGLSNCVVCYPK